MKTLYSKTRALAVCGAIFFGLLGVASSQNVRTDQIIALQNYTAPLYTIKFGASTALNTNYTFFLPAAPPTTLNQTLIVTSMNVPTSTYTLGWGTPAGPGWNTNGNSSVQSGDFLGTSDNNPLNVRVNNLRVMNLRPATSVGAGPTIIGGFASNSVDAGYNGATISGGGQNGAINTVTGDYGTIGGGSGNSAGIKSAIPGGVNLKIGNYSFGFSSDNGATVTDVSGMNNIAYFGNTNMVIGNVDNSAREIRFFEPNSSSTYSGANYTSFKAGSMSSNVSYVLPTAQGGSNTYLTNDGSGNLSWTNSSSSGVCYSVVTESAFGGTQNNLNLTNINNNTIFRISSNNGGDDDCYNDNDDDDDDGGNVYVTGINSSGVCDGKMIILVNVGNYTISLKKDNTGSSAANRFSFYKDVALTTKQGITLIYDATSQRWRMVGRPQ
jgi:hypothetical protein